MVVDLIKGEDHRLLVIDGKLVAAARRRPAHVIGDGKLTLRQLIDKENEDPRRGVGHENLLTQIQIDQQTERLVDQAGLTFESVIPPGEIVWLKSTANISTGGTATDLTDDVHPEVRYAAERIGRLMGLDIIGIDLLAETLAKPLDQQSAGVVEVNAGPGFRMHISPTHGKGRDVGKAVVDMLFPDGGDGRVPITAITGTNGKTTTTRLIARLLRQAGRQVGMACTGTIEIDNHVIMRGDYSGPMAAQTVLKEPTVDHAVLEVARGGIMRRGLGFDECDVGLLLNIASDHLGERDIHTLDELARCKTVVVDAVKPDGYCVLNADDPRVIDQGTYWSRGKIIYFSMAPDNPALDDHVRDHGILFTVKDGWIVMRQGQVEAQIIEINDVPIAFEGHAPFNVQNAMAAAAAGHALGLTLGDIASGLGTFHPTPGQLPGRANLIEADGVRCPDRLWPQRPGLDGAGATRCRPFGQATDQRRQRARQSARRGLLWRSASNSPKCTTCCSLPSPIRAGDRSARQRRCCTIAAAATAEPRSSWPSTMRSAGQWTRPRRAIFWCCWSTISTEPSSA